VYTLRKEKKTASSFLSQQFARPPPPPCTCAGSCGPHGASTADSALPYRIVNSCFGSLKIQSKQGASGADSALPVRSSSGFVFTPRKGSNLFNPKHNIRSITAPALHLRRLFRAARCFNSCQSNHHQALFRPPDPPSCTQSE
jgi:hypothetical protein